MAWTRDELLSATGGTIIRDQQNKRFGEIVTDSAKVKKGSVFIALKGERFDGHRFAGEAARRGAACVIVHQDVRRSVMRDAMVVRVPDTLRALGDLAHFRRHKLAPKVLAITGSNGKTTTKEMTAAILERASIAGQSLRGKVLKTHGNFNNLVGLPLTLLRLHKHHQVAVVELGTNRPGEIRRLCEIADPDMGIITSVAAAHLEGLDSLAGVAREKGALFRSMRADGAIAVNLEDPWVRRLGERFKGRKITYGQGGQVRIESPRLAAGRGMRFTLCIGRMRSEVRLNFVGRHNLDNAAGAAALAHGFGARLPAIRRGLESAKPFPMRMQVRSWHGIGIINDAYNANPASMVAAVKTLAEIKCAGKKIAVLGDMFELGKKSPSQHLKLGSEIAKAGIDGLYLLGAQAHHVRRGAIRGGLRAEQIVIGADHGDLARRLRERVRKGDWLLFKGSRGMKMETVLKQLQGGSA
jgi:UDP-N-acetylmuramoyl-tripeptide--D-alanyl-D-alanine ligase